MSFTGEYDHIDPTDAPLHTDKCQYRARVLRTTVMKDHATKEIMVMLQAFMPQGFVVDIKSPSGIHGSNYRLSGILHKEPDPETGERSTSAHIFVEANSRAGIYAKLLAAIIDGSGFFPMT